MHKVFITYDHERDQWYKDHLVEYNDYHRIFIDRSADTGDINDSLTDDGIRTTIRNDYLRDSTVTILLVGGWTRFQKQVDWELYSSMHDDKVNRKSGVLVFYLLASNYQIHAPHEGEREKLYPRINRWEVLKSRTTCEAAFPYMPDRIVDNLLKPEAKISVMPWHTITPERLRYLLDVTVRDLDSCEYDLSRPLKRQNTWDPR